MKTEDRTPGILKECVSEGRIFSSYLFVGPDDAGKRDLAKNFAKAINCRAVKDGKPCGACISCKKIDKEIHPDVFFIERKGASASIGIDQIRGVIEKANLKPYEGIRKVFIIDNAHSMNEASANAFLKTLEEPPGDTVFILISPSRDLLLPTIVSRCHVININRDRHHFSAENGDRQHFSADKNGDRQHFSAESNKEKCCLSPFLQATESNKEKWCLSLSDREGLKETLEFLISFFRDAFLYKTIGGEARLFNADKIDKIKNESHKFTAEGLDYLIKRLITLRSYIDYNVNPKIIADVLKGILSCER